MTNDEALEIMVRDEGYDDAISLLGDCVIDDLCPAICMECAAIARLEPDQEHGYCDSCDMNTMRSALTLAGFA